MATAELASGPAKKDRVLNHLDLPVPADPPPPPKLLTLEERTVAYPQLRLPDSRISELLSHGTLEEVREVIDLIPIRGLIAIALKLKGTNRVSSLMDP